MAARRLPTWSSATRRRGPLRGAAGNEGAAGRGERIMRIGVYGGTFDPVHIGHMAVAVNVRHALGLDHLPMVVANVPWQKVGGREVSPSADRLAMLEAAVAGLSGVEASAIELDRGGSS